MPLDRGLAGKAGGDHDNTEMAATVARAGVTRVQVAFVDYFDAVRRKRGIQRVAYALGPVAGGCWHAGSDPAAGIGGVAALVQVLSPGMIRW